MTAKLVYAVWEPDTALLHSPDWHRALADAGADRVQVNVRDEHVDGAMEIPAGSTPIGALVSLWDVDADAVTPVVARAGGAVAGWSVEERRPIDPPETWDGSRADALANIAVLRRPDGMSVEDYRHTWLVDHTPVAIATQGTFGYLQNVVQAPVTDLPDGVAPVEAVVEELFPMAGITDVHAFYGSDGSDADLNDRMTRLMTSVARFGADTGLDLVPTSRYCYTL